MSINSESPKNAVCAALPEEEIDDFDIVEFAVAETEKTYDSASAPLAEEIDRAGSDNTSVIAGAAAVGGVIGLCVCGPIGAVLTASGTACAATQRGVAGDLARSAGGLGIASGEKAKELNEKHKIIDRTKAAASAAFEKSKEYEAKHNLIEKTKTAASSTIENLSNFNTKHSVTEKVGKSMINGMDYLNKKISGSGKETATRVRE